LLLFLITNKNFYFDIKLIYYVNLMLKSIALLKNVIFIIKHFIYTIINKANLHLIIAFAFKTLTF